MVVKLFILVIVKEMVNLMNDMELIDMSDIEDTPKEKKKDRFMLGIYISLVVLVVLGLLIYFFGYDILKPFIKV